jgi:hypothetical protein
MNIHASRIFIRKSLIPYRSMPIALIDKKNNSWPKRKSYSPVLHINDEYTQISNPFLSTNISKIKWLSSACTFYLMSFNFLFDVI